MDGTSWVAVENGYEVLEYIAIGSSFEEVYDKLNNQIISDNQTGASGITTGKSLVDFNIFEVTLYTAVDVHKEVILKNLIKETKDRENQIKASEIPIEKTPYTVEIETYSPLKKLEKHTRTVLARNSNEALRLVKGESFAFGLKEAKIIIKKG